MASGFRLTRKDTRKLQDLVRTSPEKADAALRKMAEEMVSDIKLSFNTSPPGRTYTRGGVTHVASVEGYPPNVDIGTLRASIGWSPDGRLRYLVHDGVEYGIHLEDGTEHMGPRPFMAPAFEARRRTFAQFLRDEGLI